MTDDPRLQLAVAAQPYPLLFATISGAHLYGFPSPGPDYYLRGAHILPLREVVGLRPGRETIESSETLGGLQLDLVSHDARKFFGMLLKRNGYVLEQVCSPLVVRTTPWHAELLALVPRCTTMHHSHHYPGFAHTQWTLFEKDAPQQVKPLLLSVPTNIVFLVVLWRLRFPLRLRHLARMVPQQGFAFSHETVQNRETTPARRHPVPLTTEQLRAR